MSGWAAWERVTLRDVLELVTYGFTNPMPTTSEGPYMVTAKDVRDGRIDYASARRTSAESYETLLTAKSKPLIGDVLLTKDGSIGRVALVDSDVICINQSVALLRVNSRIVPKFLKYFLQSPRVQDRLEHDSGGSTIKHIYITRVGDVPIELPGTAEQRAIAEVLGALDDKIAANEAAAQIAADLVGLTFARFAAEPGAEELPYSAVADVGGGGTPKTAVEEYWLDGEVPWATPTDVTGLSGWQLINTSRSITAAGLAACSSRLYPAGSILMTSRATIGTFARAEIPMAVNQGFIVVNANDERYQDWIFHEMQTRVSDYFALANGATFLELSRGKFKAMTTAYPSAEVVEAFNLEAKPLDQLGQDYRAENTHLAILRDTLLPVLMSGKLRVRDAERTIEGVL